MLLKEVRTQHTHQFQVIRCNYIHTHETILAQIFAVRKRSLGKVLFSQPSVFHSVQGGEEVTYCSAMGSTPLRQHTPWTADPPPDKTPPYFLVFYEIHIFCEFLILILIISLEREGHLNKGHQSF